MPTSMHNPTRRTKRFKQPSYSTRRPSQLPDINDAHTNFQDSPPSSPNHVRLRQAGGQPDALRGAMLVALIVVTIVLYFMLWELERSSFASVPKPNWTQSVVMAASPSARSSTSESASTRYPPTVVHWHDRLDVTSGEQSESNLSDRIAVPPSKPGRTIVTNAWPPPVTRVPEQYATEHPNLAKLSSFDSAYCNGSCRFLLPVHVGEQESKARIHFMQLLALAKRLGRTIVLPNVGNSRMGACSKWPFDTYYDTTGFVHKSDAPDSWLAMNLERFAKWVDERPVPPNSFVVAMESRRQDRRDMIGAQRGSKDVPFVVEKAAVDSKVLSCLESKLARLRSTLPEMALSISFDSGSFKAGSDASSRLVELLSNSVEMDTDSESDSMMEPGYNYTPQYTNASSLSLEDTDVLILDYDLRHPLFPTSDQANFNLHYTPVLYDLADRLSENLGPFLGVHWRMENVPVQNLAWCAVSLVSTLHALLQDDVTGDSVRHVWLATDHPRPLRSFYDGVRFPVADDRNWNGIGNEKGRSLPNDGPLRKSSTFKTLSVEHDDAIGILAEAFQFGGDLEAWTLTDLAEQLRRYPYVEGRFDVNETVLGDSGVLGIVDKLVMVQARVFVSGSADCSKTRFVLSFCLARFGTHVPISSFSKQVIEARQESFEAKRGTGVIRNVVEHFGK